MQDVVAALREAGVKDEIEIVDDMVYVNFDYLAAVVVELGDKGELVATATAWDRSGGVEREHEIGAARNVPMLARVVAGWLRVRHAETERMEAILAQMPDD